MAPLEYSSVPTGNRCSDAGLDDTGGSTQPTVISTAYWLWHPTKSCVTTTVSPLATLWVRSTTGPPFAPTWTPFMNTEITASDTNWVSVMRSSPACTGPTSGAGRLEHG